MKRLLVLTVFTALICLYSFESHSLKEFSTEILDIAKNSSDIVVAKCISSESRYDEKTGFVYTYTTFKVVQDINNSLGEEEIRLRVVGGQDGDIRTDVHGLKKFDVNQEMVLFLGPQNSKGYHTLSSVINGSLNVHVDESTGKKYIENPPPDIVPDLSTKTGKQDEGVVYLEDFLTALNNIK